MPDYTPDLHLAAMYHITTMTAHLLREYNQKLIESGFGIRRKDLKQKDIIDVRNIFIEDKTGNSFEMPDTRLTNDEKSFSEQNNWYCYVPCFVEGVIQIKTNRYIHWKIIEIKPYDNEITLELQDYIYFDESGWNPGVTGIATLNFNNSINPFTLEPKYETKINENKDSVFLFSRIYRILDLEKDLKWSKMDIDIWNKLVVGNAEQTEKVLKEERFTDNFELLIKHFLNIMVKVNYRIEMNKPVTKRQTKINSATTPKKKIAELPENPDKRRIRTIGDIVVTSDSIPRKSKQSNIIKYKVASWKTKGFVRTYKSGKKVLVSESIHHRHCLSDKDNNGTQPVTINFKKRR